MLVLSRKINETIEIEIPPSAEPQWISIRLKVRLGVDAARSINIWRGELQQEIQNADADQAQATA